MITSYDKLTIGKYTEIQEILHTEYEEFIEIQPKILAVLADKTEEEVLNLPISKYAEMVQQSSFVLEPPKVKGKSLVDLNINGRVFTFIRNTQDITASQYIDYQTLVTKEDNWRYLANILACFIVPKGGTYCVGYDIFEVVQWLNDHMDVYTAMDTCFFFRKKSLRSIRRSLRYSEALMRVLSWKTKNQRMKDNLRRKRVELEEASRDLQEFGDGGLW
jgi:hypothetical protein